MLSGSSRLFSVNNIYIWKQLIMSLPVAAYHERTDIDIVNHYEKSVQSMFGDIFNPHIYLLRAMLYEKLKEYDNAIALYDQVIERFPTFGHGYLYKAQLLQDLNKYQESSEVLDSFICNKEYKLFTDKEKTDYQRLNINVLDSIQMFQNK